GGRPFRWTATQGIEELPILPSGMGGAALAVNDSGVVVGVSSDGYDAAQRAVRWQTNKAIDSIACCYASAVGVNAAGAVTGLMGSDFRGFRWTATEGLLDLGRLPGMTATKPVAINAVGQIAGYSWTGGQSRAFVWTEESGMRDL